MGQADPREEYEQALQAISSLSPTQQQIVVAGLLVSTPDDDLETVRLTQRLIRDLDIMPSPEIEQWTRKMIERYGDPS